jgi:acetyl-CoA C-acetyltransferase
MSTMICAAKRSAIGSFQGTLSSLPAPKIAAPVIQALLSESKVDPASIQEVFMGCVLSAGLGQAPARQASIYAEIPKSVPCSTISKVCGSGLKSVMLADLSIRSGEIDVALAGGMENMSQAPYLVPKIRTGLRMGHSDLVDSMIKDGLWDVYSDFHMGNATEICVKEHKITREAQDAYAVQSYTRAQAAIKANLFAAEVAPISIKGKKGIETFATDEEAVKAQFEKFATLRPVFEKDGTLTAANASSLSDGAAALLLTSESHANAKGLTPLARIVAQAQAAQEPTWFTTAPALSIEILLKKAGLKTSDIDAWEINEAFAAVALVNLSLLKLDPAKVNKRGGAIALGHPIGASGARILTTLVHTLAQEKLRYGVASLCIGGGEAVSVLVENLQK